MHVPHTQVVQVSVVVPAFNESENLPRLYTELTHVLSEYGGYEIIVVDDGSSDNTLDVLKHLAATDDRVRYISFSRNFGHQTALRAGLDHSRGACVISLDADLQHPPEIIHQLVQKWREGFEIVTTIRADVDSDSWTKRTTSRLFYALINKISDCRIEPASADFRLLDRVVVDQLGEFRESELFLRGLLPWLGFKTAKISYIPNTRLYGESKYRLGKMIALASSAVLAHSTQPLRISTILAAAIASLTALYGIYALVVYIFVQRVVPGWASIVMAVSFLGALQLLVLGIIGEYLGRVLREVRRRPPYVVRETNATDAHSAADTLLSERFFRHGSGGR